MPDATVTGVISNISQSNPNFVSNCLAIQTAYLLFNESLGFRRAAKQSHLGYHPLDYSSGSQTF